jgi:hypothetical protein
MKCIQCVKENKKSTLFARHGMIVTNMGFTPYYDEEGRYHSHDPNLSTQFFECSNGHVSKVTTLKKCGSCDFGKETVELVEMKK